MLHSIGSVEKRSKETFKFQIRSQDDSFQIELFSWSTIHVLKEMIQNKTGIKLKDQRLFYDNQELIRNNQNMFDYNISEFFLFLIIYLNLKTTYKTRGQSFI